MMKSSIFRSSAIDMIEFSLNNYEFYLSSFFFSLGNVLLPMIFHYFKLGGEIFLPIYFFILVGSYAYGWRVGLATAVISPLLNLAATGMPVPAMMPVVIVKGSLLALSAYLIAKRTKNISIMNILLVIVAYQGVGMVFEAVYLANFSGAVSHVLIAWPGMLIQLIPGFLLIKGFYNAKKVDG